MPITVHLLTGFQVNRANDSMNMQRIGIGMFVKGHLLIRIGFSVNLFSDG
ncbi:hypothetical protein QYC20_17395 (plasmid) [Lactiplantibacillus pentosus]|nr:hypothetical protein [Lactiplantibacillus pentosus]WKF77738.1 hypothetical protein QYC20_17395 [Lactiplantibacillus pentosus]